MSALTAGLGKFPSQADVEKKSSAERRATLLPGRIRWVLVMESMSRRGQVAATHFVRPNNPPTEQPRRTYYPTEPSCGEELAHPDRAAAQPDWL